MKPITIVIVDDHQLLSEALSMVLSEDLRLKVLACCSTAEAAIDVIEKLTPHIILLDINLPGVNGIDATPIIHQMSPDSKIICISLHASPAYVRKMILHGASGYVSKNASRQEIIEAIIEVAAGKKFICQYTKKSIAEHFTKETATGQLKTLTTREREITDLLKKGLSSKEIGVTLYISAKTVEVHRYNILKKLNLKNTASLINFISKEI